MAVSLKNTLPNIGSAASSVSAQIPTSNSQFKPGHHVTKETLGDKYQSSQPVRKEEGLLEAQAPLPRGGEVLDVQGEKEVVQKEIESSKLLSLDQMRSFILNDVPFEKRGSKRYYDLGVICENIKQMDFSYFVSDEEPIKQVTISGEISKTFLKNIKVEEGDLDISPLKYKISLSIEKINGKVFVKILSYGGVNYINLLAACIDHPQVNLSQLAKEDIESWEVLVGEYLNFKVLELFNTEKSNHSVKPISEESFFDVIQSQEFVEKILNMRIVQSLPVGEYFYFRLYYLRQKSQVKKIRMNTLEDEKGTENTGLIFYVKKSEKGDLRMAFSEPELSEAKISAYNAELVCLGLNQALDWNLSYELDENSYHETLKFMLEYTLFGYLKGMELKSGWSVGLSTKQFLHRITLKHFKNFLAKHSFFEPIREELDGKEYILTSLVSGEKNVESLGVREAPEDQDFFDLSANISQVRIRLVLDDDGVRVIPLKRKGMKSYEITKKIFTDYSHKASALVSEKYQHPFGAFHFAEDFDLLGGVKESWGLANLFVDSMTLRGWPWNKSFNTDRVFVLRTYEYSGNREGFLESLNLEKLRELFRSYPSYSFLQAQGGEHEFVLYNYATGENKEHFVLMKAKDEDELFEDDSVVQIRFRLSFDKGEMVLDPLSRSGEGSLELCRSIFLMYSAIARDFLSENYMHRLGLVYFVADRNLAIRVDRPKLLRIAKVFLSEEEYASLEWNEIQ